MCEARGLLGLRDLEADGFVHREIYHQVPPKVEYSLTELGASLNEALLPLGNWGTSTWKRLSPRTAAAGPAGRAPLSRAVDGCGVGRTR